MAANATPVAPLVGPPAPHGAEVADLDTPAPEVERDLDARQLARAENLRGLQCLDLGRSQYGGTDLGEEGIEHLANSSVLTGLTALSLHRVPLSDKAAAYLANSPTLANLTALDLCSTKLTDDAASQLLASKHLDRLVYLDVRDHKLSATTQEALKKRWPFVRLA